MVGGRSAQRRRRGQSRGQGRGDQRGEPARLGFELKTDSSKALAGSLDTCTDPREPFLNTLIRIMATRCMTPAQYFCSGDVAEPDYRHYGIATEIYTHFTSPIRRYADLMAHRQLAAAIGYEEPDSSTHSKDKLEKICLKMDP